MEILAQDTVKSSPPKKAFFLMEKVVVKNLEWMGLYTLEKLPHSHFIVYALDI